MISTARPLSERWRGFLRLSAALLLVAGAEPVSAQGTGSVRGVVRAEGSGDLLEATVVELRAGAARRSALTGPSGSYELRDVPSGRRTIRVRHLGYTPLEVEVVVPAGQALELDLTLRPEPVVLAPVRVAGGSMSPGADTLAAPEGELSRASSRVLQSSPGLAEIGLTEAITPEPGQDPVDPTDVLYVRGAGSDLKLVYLDGAPVYAPFPLGGLVEPFAPDLLQSASIYLGGAPARYDGGLSYVLDLRTRGVRSERAHSSGAVDMLAARAVVEVPIGDRAGVLVSGRSVHDIGTRPVSSNPLPYGYREGLLRGDLRIGETGVFSVTGFVNTEEVWLSKGSAPDSTIRWGNAALSLRYRARLGGTTAEVTASSGQFAATLPLLGAEPALMDGSSTRSRIAADFVREMAPVTVRYGASFDRQRQGYERSAGPGGGSREILGKADIGGAYADVGWQLSPRVRLRGGLRADLPSTESALVLAPRVALSWLATERAVLTVAAGRYHQYLRPTGGLLATDGFTLLQGSIQQELVLGSSSHLSLALDQDLGDGLRLGIEGFFKEFEDIPGGAAAAANASGFDLWIRRATGRWNGWAGYSLAWVWSLPDREQNTRFAGRHLLSAGVAAPLGEKGKLSAGFAYGAGLPYSAIPIASSVQPTGLSGADTRLESAAGAAPLLPEPTRPYLRLDLSASRTWSARAAGASIEVAPYVRLLNALGHRDALFYRFDRDEDEAPRALLVLPVVPVLGVEWRF